MAYNPSNKRLLELWQSVKITMNSLLKIVKAFPWDLALRVFEFCYTAAVLDVFCSSDEFITLKSTSARKANWANRRWRSQNKRFSLFCTKKILFPYLYILNKESHELSIGTLRTLTTTSASDTANAAFAAHTVSITCWTGRGKFQMAFCGEEEGRDTVKLFFHQKENVRWKKAIGSSKFHSPAGFVTEHNIKAPVSN